jgi:(R,R)-butanediol dehydrogenase/meso-butanediol dehydrogenase/diacetyl reductase
MKALVFSVNIPQYLGLQVLGKISPKLYYKGPLATVRLKDVAEPELPGPGWVKIRNRLCGVCASDMNVVFLKDSPTASPFASFPCIFGHEIMGEIIDTGSDVKELSVGDRVTIAPHLDCAAREISPVCETCRSGRVGSCENVSKGKLAPGMFTGVCSDIGGGFAPYLVAHQSQVFKLPENIPPEAGVMIEPFAVALQAVIDNMPEPGDTVLVIGGGVIGSLIVSSIRAFGIDCNVTVADPSPAAADTARKAGADNVICGGNIFGRTAEITGAERYKPMMGEEILMGGYKRIFDAVGHAGTINTAMRCLASSGVLSVVGIGGDVKLDLTPLWLKLQTIKGAFSYGYTNITGEKKHVFDIAIELVKEGKVNLSEMVTHRFSIDELEKMIKINLNKGSHGAIKTVVTFE